MQNLQEDFFARARRVCGTAGTALHEPRLNSVDREYVTKCLDENFVSSVGRFVDEFERQLAEFTGARRAVVVSSGTVALHAALHAVGVGPGDEVLIPSLSFVATANAVKMCHAIPHFVDVSPRTLGMDPEALRAYLTSEILATGSIPTNKKTRRPIKAIVPMHCFGFSVEMPALLALAQELRIPVIEDAAEALGSYAQEQHLGTLGQAGVLSFNGNKILTTGGGGAILTNDEELGRRIKHVTTTGKVAHPWKFFHDTFAFNYRLPNINAALGCAQMQRLPALLADKRTLHEKYRAAFSGCDYGHVVEAAADCRANYWLNTFLLHEPQAAELENLLEAATREKLALRPTWEPLHTLPYLQDCPQAPLPVTLNLRRRIVNLPSSPHLVHEK